MGHTVLILRALGKKKISAINGRVQVPAAKHQPLVYPDVHTTSSREGVQMANITAMKKCLHTGTWMRSPNRFILYTARSLGC